MAEVAKLLFGISTLVRNGHIEKSQGEKFKELVLAKNEKAIVLHTILDKKPYEEEFASRVKAVLAETSNSAPSSSLAIAGPSSSASSSSSSIIDDEEHNDDQFDPDHLSSSPSKGRSKLGGRPKPLNLAVVSAANKSSAAQKADEEAAQADELLKIKRMRQAKRQSLPERLPTEVQHKVGEGGEKKPDA